MSRRPLLLALLATLVAGACGGPGPEELLDRAPDALDDAETSRFELRVTAAGEGVDSEFTATGEQDLVEGTLRMVTEMGLEATTTRTLVLGETMYLRSQLFALFTGDPDAWVRIDLAEAGRRAGLDLDAVVGGHTGPAALVHQLRGAVDEVEELGDEEVRGVPTRRLRVVVDTERAIEQSPEQLREQLRTFAEASGLPTTYPMEVWIDDDALVRRVRTDVEVEDEAAGPVTQRTTLEMFDFGIPVDLEPPDEADVVELEALLDDLAALEEQLGEGRLDLDADADADPDE